MDDGNWVWGETKDPWGREVDDALYGTTPLKKVTDWEWHRYKVEFLAGEQVIKTVEFIGTDGPRHHDFDVEWGGMQWPQGADRYTWECIEENLDKVRNGIRITKGKYGMETTGVGWK